MKIEEAAERSQLHQRGAVKAAIMLVWLQRSQEVDFLKNLVVGMPTWMQEGIVGECGMTRY
jgi:hypothetical protein